MRDLLLQGALTSTRRHARLCAAVAGTVAVIALPCATARAAGDVIVAPAGGAPTTVSVPALVEQLPPTEHPFVVRSAAGDSALTVRGASIDRLLGQAGIDPFAFEGMTIEGGGRSVELPRDALVDPAFYPDGQRPVFFVDAQDALTFLRPSTGPGDLNGDEMVVVPGGDITLTLAKQAELDVRLVASRTRIEAGQTVTFTATVIGTDPGEQVDVRWTFGDGRGAAGARVKHRFGRRGNYKVVVGATSAQDATGGDDWVRIHVGKSSEGGPDREGGGTNTNPGAPDSGAATGAAGPAASSEVAPAAPTQPKRRRAATPAPRSSPAAPARPAEPVPPRDQQRAVREAVPGGAPAQVEGVLLSDAAAAPSAAAADAVLAARTGTPKDDDAASGAFATVPPAAAGSLAVLALLGLGAWWERRGLPRRFD